MPDDDLVRLVEQMRDMGRKPKPEVGIQFGAGGATSAGELEAQGTRDAGLAVRLAKRYLDAGADRVMIEPEGITESVKTWRTDVAAKFIAELGLDKLTFEAAEPGGHVVREDLRAGRQLFPDHSQIVRLEALRAGIWGTKSALGRILTYKPKAA